MSRREMTASRRPSSPAPPTRMPLEDEDLLAEILLRLPPQPSSLPRARAVSRRWRILASDPRFCARFRAHHHHRRSTPLLGCFVRVNYRIHFQPALEAPNRVPEGCFTFPLVPGDRFGILGCRHGLVLLLQEVQHQLWVWDPVTGDRHRLDLQPGFDTLEDVASGAVLRAAAGDHHFQVVLVGSCDTKNARARLVASVYSSKTGAWGNLVSTPIPSDDVPAIVCSDVPAVMLGSSLYWLFTGNSEGIVEFDLDTCSIALIPMPENYGRGRRFKNFGDVCVIPQKGGGLGLLCLLRFTAELWERETYSDGVASWFLGRTILLNELLPIDIFKRRAKLWIIGLAEDNNMVLVKTSIGIFTLHLESLQSKKISELNNRYLDFYPFEGVYTADKGIDGGHDGAELLRNV